MRLLAAISTAILCFVIGVASYGHSQEQHEAEGKPAAHNAARPAEPAAQPRQEQVGRPGEHPQAEPSGRPDAARPHSQEEAPRAPQRDERAYPSAHQQEAAPPQHTEEGRPPQHEPAPKPPQADERARPAYQPSTQGQPAYREQQPSEPAYRGQEQRQPAQRHADDAVWQQYRAQNWHSQHRTWRERGGYQGYRIPEDQYRAEFGRPHMFHVYSYPVVFVSGYPRFHYGGYWVQVVDPWPEYWAPDWYDTDDVYIDYWNDGYYLFDPRYPGDPLAVEIFR